MIRLLFAALLGFHVLFQMGFVGQIIFMPEATLNFFEVPFEDASDHAGLLMMVAAGQVFVILASATAIFWTYRAPSFGIPVGIAVGLMFLGIGLSLVVLNRGFTGIELLDLARGGATVVTGALALSQRGTGA